MSILDKIVEEKKREIAKLPARIIAAGDLRDAMLERGESRDFTAALRVVRCGHSERFHHRGERLFNVECRVAFPARVEIELPFHPRQRGTDQTIIDLPRDRPFLGIDFSPARFELAQLFAASLDRASRPIARPSRPLDPIYIIARERRILGPPTPEIAREFV